MAHLDHDAVVDAFQRVAAQRGDPTPLRMCDRAGDTGYTHIHGPHQPQGLERCTTHAIAIEKYNGTVALRAPIGQHLGAVQRPDMPITKHSLGYSAGAFGDFDYAFDVPHILKAWSTFDAFARHVIASLAASSRW